MMINAKKVWLLVVVLVVAGSLNWQAKGQELKVKPEVKRAAATLYPEAGGVVRLDFEEDAAFLELGFRLTRYHVVSAKGELGKLSRIQTVGASAEHPGVDILVRFAADGKVLDLVSVAPWKIGEKRESVAQLLNFVRGKKVVEMKEDIQVFFNGLEMATQFHHAGKAPEPAAGEMIRLENKILTTGAKLPNISFTTLGGKVFNANADIGGPIVLVFFSLRDPRVPDFVRITELGRTGMPKNPEVGPAAAKMRFYYIVGGTAEMTRNFARRVGLPEDVVVADAMDALAKSLMVPFKPYVLVFSGERKLAANLAEIIEDQFLGVLYAACGGKLDGEDVEEGNPQG
ncbi:MAG: hypothetical protein D6820_04225, partial [Lentisphaerae bacterium]